MEQFVPTNYDVRTALIFLLPFEANCCRIASHVCRSLRWSCSW